MRTIYINCENGVSGDMVLNALTGLTEEPDAVKAEIERISAEIDKTDHNHHHDHEHAHGHSDHFHRSYKEVVRIINSTNVNENVKSVANNIYSVIAKAESAVHGDSLDELHFHEVGRNQAIANVIGAAVCIDKLNAEQLFASEICDGHGTVKCAHGVLNVPVPAVKAMLDDNYDKINYRQTEYEGEMVTPSGLAMIIGIGAVKGDRPDCEPVRCSEAKGARSFSGNGLVAELFEV